MVSPSLNQPKQTIQGRKVASPVLRVLRDTSDCYGPHENPNLKDSITVDKRKKKVNNRTNSITIDTNPQLTQKKKEILAKKRTIPKHTSLKSKQAN
jgi:hypothetical protein